MTPRDEAIEAMARAIADPGKYAGFRGDKGMSHWQAEAALDALLDHLNEPGEEMVEAASECKIDDGEGGYAYLFDLLDFSGENKTRTVIRTILRAALNTLREMG